MEVGLDDCCEDSNFLKIDGLMRKFMKNYYQVCEIANLDPCLGWKKDKPFNTESSRIPLVNERIMDFINVKKETPDFNDIMNIFMEVNAEKQLGYCFQALKDQGIDCTLGIGKLG